MVEGSTISITFDTFSISDKASLSSENIFFKTSYLPTLSNPTFSK